MPLSNYYDIEKNLGEIEEDALVRLVCVSHRSGKISENAWLEQVFKDYCTFNQSNDIKGFSCKGGTCFFQCLEGVKKSLLMLMVKIFADKRHKSVKVILSEPIARCGFSVWHRHCLNLEKPLFSDASIISELQQYLPFKPMDWPVWYIEYFVETMQKFNREGAAYQHNQNYAHNHHYSRSHCAKRDQQDTISTPSPVPTITATIAMTFSRQPLLVIFVLLVLIAVLMVLLV